ncbi:uncharacterized protein DNG_08670 [Cephalotrichum gorgonifer]|uniref:Uncharacterized protein n=1 Tax=Cephalotrichum gorgonifer TaxID=2041049 RepID=A0AAE8N404_9PEZI|nr:uncharacterized protein DNG_08670 [Cephalotrichum gorgonifer]
MPKVPLNPKATTHALRGLALGTSCSLVFLSEERRRRLELARTLVDNGRLIKSLRCYSAGGAEAVQVQVQAENMYDARLRDGHIASDQRFLPSMVGIEGIGTGMRTLSNPAPRRRAHWPKFPDIREVPCAGTTGKITMRMIGETGSKPRTPLHPKTASSQPETTPLSPETAPLPQEKVPLHSEAAAAPSHREGTPSIDEEASAARLELQAFYKDFARFQSLRSLPAEFLESSRYFLLRLEQQDDVATAQLVLDQLCHHRSIDSRHLDGVTPEFILRCILSERTDSYDLVRPSRRYRLAAFVFWLRHQLISIAEARDPGAKAELMKLLAKLFARDNSDYDIQSFIATIHVQFGRYFAASAVVVEVAKLYREQDEAALLERWIRLANEAGVDMRACPKGRELLDAWEAEDRTEEPMPKLPSCMPLLKEELRKPLDKEKPHLDEGQRALFDQMDKKSMSDDWAGVLDCYSKGLGAGTRASVPCLRLAVEAAVELEGIHSTTALTLLEEAYNASVNVDPVVQTVLISRFNDIGNYQQVNRATAEKGRAYSNMMILLEQVKPFYKQPSEVVYNRAIRVCLRNWELKEVTTLCMQVAKEFWNGDALYMINNFASLVTVAARTQDYGLLQRLLEALPWRPYHGHPICKTVLQDARRQIRKSVRNSLTVEERTRHEDALGYVEIAYQSAMAVRIAKHRDFRDKLRERVFSELTPSVLGKGKKRDRSHKTMWQGTKASEDQNL